MSIKAIIFDMEGVLMKTRDADLYLTMSKALGKPYEQVRPIFFDEFNDYVDTGKALQIEFDRRLIRKLGLDEEKVPLVQQVVNEQAFIDSELVARIEELKKEYKIGLLSNYSEVMRPKIENEWRISHLFDAIIISSEVGVVKPDPEIFEITLSRLKVSPHEAILIDDRIKNIDGAEDFGMHAILYKTRAQTLTDLDILIQNQKTFI